MFATVPTLDEVLKDSLFDDTLFAWAVGYFGPDAVREEIAELKDSLVFQLSAREGTDEWRRKVTALVIRAKGRLRELR